MHTQIGHIRVFIREYFLVGISTHKYICVRIYMRVDIYI